MSLLARLSRPEYLLRPAAGLRRLRLGTRPFAGSNRISTEASLPWAQTITVLPDESGRDIALSGIFDLCLTEAVYRLLEPGGLAVDVGANVGYVTNVMATRLGPSGTVIAFEPFPPVFEVLQTNAARWTNDDRVASVEVRRLAVSTEAGAGRLGVAEGWEAHTGLASLHDPSGAGGREDVEVELARLDDLLGDREVQLLKVDVEGHEHAVFEGAERMLAARRIRDVVFEDHEIYPTPAMTLLEAHGMTVLTIDRSLLGLRVHPVAEGPAPAGWPGPNYLATLDPERARQRLRGRGWRCLARERGHPG